MLAFSGNPGGVGGLFGGSSGSAGYLFVTMLLAGAGLLFPGIWLWSMRREPRAEMGERMDRITERLDELERVEGDRPGSGEHLYQPAPPSQPPPDVQNYQL
jgi:hypothetical protein